MIPSNVPTTSARGVNSRNCTLAGMYGSKTVDDCAGAGVCEWLAMTGWWRESSGAALRASTRNCEDVQDRRTNLRPTQAVVAVAHTAGEGLLDEGRRRRKETHFNFPLSALVE